MMQDVHMKLNPALPCQRGIQQAEEYFCLQIGLKFEEETGEIGDRGDSWHTFHFIIFHIFSVIVKLNVTARMASNTLGLQSDLHKFDAIHKE
jgi:hypothetical protein